MEQEEVRQEAAAQQHEESESLLDKAIRATPGSGYNLRLPKQETLGRLNGMVKAMYGTAFVPESLDGLNRDQRQRDPGLSQRLACANAIAIVMAGAEMGFQPMESLRGMNIIKGKLIMSYHLMLRHMLREGVLLDWKQQDDQGALLEATSPRNGYTVKGRWTPEDSRRAGLLENRGTERSNHEKYPADMNIARAVSRVYHRIGIGGSDTYTYEEVPDIIASEEERVKSRVEKTSQGANLFAELSEAIIPIELQQQVQEAAHKAKLEMGPIGTMLLDIQLAAQEQESPQQYAADSISEWMRGVAAVVQDAAKDKEKKRTKPKASEQAKAPPPEPAQAQGDGFLTQEDEDWVRNQKPEPGPEPEPEPEASPEVPSDIKGMWE